MEIKNPIGQSGFSIDAFTDGIRNSPNNTTASVSCKQRCGSKNPPHSNNISSNANLIHVYVGDGALEEALEANFWIPDAVIALPPNRSPYEFTWPVEGTDKLTILHQRISN